MERRLKPKRGAPGMPAVAAWSSRRAVSLPSSPAGRRRLPVHLRGRVLHLKLPSIPPGEIGESRDMQTESGGAYTGP
ncbi:unnamed protein product [Lampetra planeri]